MGRKMVVASIAALVAIIWSSLVTGVHSSALDRVRRQADTDAAETATTAASDNTTTATTNTTMAKHDHEDDSSTVTVTVIVVILVLAVVITVGVFIFLRVRRRRMADYEKKTQIQMSSARNAGVYVDLTSAPAGDEKEKPAESPETERLNKEED